MEGYRNSYIEWGVVIAGVVVACALSFVLLQFGAAIGLTQIDFNASPDANVTPGGILGTGIWLLWVQLVASLTGGYLAGRMRSPLTAASQHERDMRDGVHGLLVWATSTLAVVVAASVAAAFAGLTDPDPVQDAAVAADVAAMRENVALIFAFGAAATSLVSAVVSWWAATAGGDHRDTAADHTRYFTFRVIR
ncbi:MAG TPA: hypothetical protein VFS88_01445 [Micavibrio sp.]|nr:hypothetical protein [Micavibrio sp.]